MSDRSAPVTAGATNRNSFSHNTLALLIDLRNRLASPPCRPSLPWAAWLLFSLACVYPTERSAGLRVEIDEIPELLAGEIHRLSATVVDAAGTPVPNGEVAFASEDAQVAVVDVTGAMLATGPGVTQIRARAVGFEEAEPGVETVRIHDQIEIDSVRPLQVRFGDTLNIYGAGLNPEPFGPGTQFISVLLGPVEAVPKSYAPNDPDAPNRFGRLTVWVPPPTPPLVGTAVFGVEGLALNDRDTIRVLQRDLYEPNDTIPADLGVLDPSFHNPALAFELRPRDDSLRTDWYRITRPTAGDVSILLRSSNVSAETYQAYFTDSLAWNGDAQEFQIGPSAFTIGPGLYACRGVPFVVPQFPAESTIVALRDLPAGTYDFLIGYGAPGRYELTVRNEYVSSVQPDSFEENDFCDVAKPWTLGESKLLTIDNPRDIDWFRFDVAGAPVPARFEIQSEAEGSDLDIYVLRDYTPDSLVVVGVSQIGGETDEVTAVLSPGAYFLVSVDFAGVATPYRLSSAVVAAEAAAETVAPAGARVSPVFRLPLGGVSR